MILALPLLALAAAAAQAQSATIVRILLATWLLLTATAASAQQPPDLPAAVRRAGDRITAAELERDLRTLAQDAWNGRASLSPGLDSAAAFIIGRIARAGLTPLGDSGTYRQYYTVREVAPDPAGSFVAIGSARFSGADIWDAGFSGASAARDVPVVYVGHGRRIPSADMDPFAGVDVRGKLVLAHFNSRPPGMLTGPLPRDAAPPVFAALERGALGVLYLPNPFLQSNWDQLARGPSTFRELDPAIPSAYARRVMRHVALRPHAVDALLAGSGHTAASLMAGAARGEYPASFELPRRATVVVAAGAERLHRGYNVVAMLGGGDARLRGEVVTVFAHLDGAVGQTPTSGDTVWNAADDNATGSAGVLRIAEELARRDVPRPRRSIVFVWDSGEEVGLWGSRSFVGRPVVPLDRIAAHFNIDMIGGTRAPGRADSAATELSGPNEVWLIGPRGLASDLDSLLNQVNRSYVGMRFDQSHDREGDQFFYPRTDAGPFLERGVPTIGFFTGMHARYHRPSDEADDLDPVKMEQVARTALAAIWMVADLPQRPRFTVPASVPRHGPLTP